MLPKCLVPHVKDFTFSPDRQKVSGRMYGGSAKAEVDGHVFDLQLWYHGNDDETAARLVSQLTLQSVDGKDAHWHVIWTHEGIWLHPTGWFDNEYLEMHPVIQGRPNQNFVPYEVDERKLLDLDFVKVL